MGDRAKPILCLDFDGVIHSYSSGWKGAAVIPDPPVPGALQFIVAAMEHFTVAIYSSRSGEPGGIKAMVEWLGRWSVDPVYGMPPDFDHGAWGAIQWPTSKPPAMVAIDDRVLTFTGTWPTIETLQRFKPWNKREDSMDTRYDVRQHWLSRQWRWRLVAGNGRIIATSGESCRNKRDCLDAIELVKGSHQARVHRHS